MARVRYTSASNPALVSAVFGLLRRGACESGPTIMTPGPTGPLSSAAVTDDGIGLSSFDRRKKILSWLSTLMQQSDAEPLTKRQSSSTTSLRSVMIAGVNSDLLAALILAICTNHPIVYQPHSPGCIAAMGLEDLTDLSSSSSFSSSTPYDFDDADVYRICLEAFDAANNGDLEASSRARREAEEEVKHGRQEEEEENDSMRDVLNEMNDDDDDDLVMIIDESAAPASKHGFSRAGKVGSSKAAARSNAAANSTAGAKPSQSTTRHQRPTSSRGIGFGTQGSHYSTASSSNGSNALRGARDWRSSRGWTSSFNRQQGDDSAFITEPEVTVVDAKPVSRRESDKLQRAAIAMLKARLEEMDPGKR